MDIHAALRNTDPAVLAELLSDDISIDTLNALLQKQRGVHPPKVVQILENIK